MSDKDAPRRWRSRLRLISAGRLRYMHGCYFPATDLNVTDMGQRGTGEPRDVVWLDDLVDQVVVAARAERAAVRATIACASDGTEVCPRGSPAWLNECSRLDTVAIEAAEALDAAIEALDKPADA